MNRSNNIGLMKNTNYDDFLCFVSLALQVVFIEISLSTYVSNNLKVQYIIDKKKYFNETFPRFKCQVTTDQLGTYLYFLRLRVTL